MYPELVVGVGSCFLEFVMGVDIYGIVVVVLGSSKIENNVQWGECLTIKHICFIHSQQWWRYTDGMRTLIDNLKKMESLIKNFEKMESFITFLEQWEQMDSVGEQIHNKNEFSREESIAIKKINNKN